MNVTMAVLLSLVCSKFSMKSLFFYSPLPSHKQCNCIAYYQPSKYNGIHLNDQYAACAAPLLAYSRSRRGHARGRAGKGKYYSVNVPLKDGIDDEGKKATIISMIAIKLSYDYIPVYRPLAYFILQATSRCLSPSWPRSYHHIALLQLCSRFALQSIYRCLPVLFMLLPIGL